MMPEYTVEVHGQVRELYTVEADSAEDARRNWTDGHMYYSESWDSEVYSVTEDEE